jgi:hypothetical protein
MTMMSLPVEFPNYVRTYAELCLPLIKYLAEAFVSCPYLGLQLLLAQQLFPQHLQLAYHLGQAPFLLQERLPGERLVQDRRAVHHGAIDNGLARRRLGLVLTDAVDQHFHEEIDCALRSGQGKKGKVRTCGL